MDLRGRRLVVRVQQLKYRSPYFGGPSAPWADEDDDLYPHDEDVAFRLDRMASALATGLEIRAAKLRSSSDVETILAEIRCQIAAACVLDNFLAVGELTDMMLEVQELAAASKQEKEGQTQVNVNWDEPESEL
jgi:hypothetical protein